MKKLLLTVFAAATLAITALAEQKTIKDPAEYNAYMTALNTQNADKKANAMVAFVEKYPASVMRIDAMEQAMAAYQQSGNVAKVEEMAGKILQLSPDDVRALAIVVFIERGRAGNGDKDALKELGGNAAHGLKALETWTAPDGVPAEDFEKLRDQMTEIFNGAAGFAALQKRDYAAARGYYLKSVSLDPANLQDIYQLALADLESKPLDADGFWYAARAAGLAGAQKNAAAEKSILTYGKAKYRRYHGGEDGWDKIVSAAAHQTTLPDGFSSSIKRAPTPAELAVKAVIENDPAQLSFSDWEYVLSYRDTSPANEAAAKKIWDAIEAKQKNGAAKLSIPVKIISSEEKTIQAAITEENQKADKVDLEVTLAAPLKQRPTPGTQVKIVGVLSDYKTNPFMFLMKDGALSEQPPSASAPAP